MARIQPARAGVRQAVQEAFDAKAQPPGSLGRLEELAGRVAAILGTATPDLRAFGGSATRVAFSPPATVLTSPKPTPAARLEIDFAPGSPDLNSFLAREWLWACWEAPHDLCP